MRGGIARIPTAVIPACPGLSLPPTGGPGPDPGPIPPPLELMGGGSLLYAGMTFGVGHVLAHPPAVIPAKAGAQYSPALRLMLGWGCRAGVYSAGVTIERGD